MLRGEFERANLAGVFKRGASPSSEKPLPPLHNREI
jgi:hypothetical protein